MRISEILVHREFIESVTTRYRYDVRHFAGQIELRSEPGQVGFVQGIVVQVVHFGFHDERNYWALAASLYQCKCVRLFTDPYGPYRVTMYVCEPESSIE